MQRQPHRVGWWIAFLVLLAASPTSRAAPRGELELNVIDQATRQPIPARLRITNSQRRAPHIRNAIRQGSDVTFEGPLTIKLPVGNYTFSLDRGPHYKQVTGHVKVVRDGFDQKTLSLPRFANLRAEGWYGGDLLVARPHDDLPLLLRAEELDFAVARTWTAGSALTRLQARVNRSTQPSGDAFVDFSSGVCPTDTGTLLVANLKSAIDPPAMPTSNFEFAKAMRKSDSAHLVLLEPFAWDLPTLVAHGLVDSVAVLHPLLRLDGDAPSITRGRAPTGERYELRGGIGRYSQDIYFHLLNCGLRIAPSAASGSGDCDNPPGYNRAYVYCGQDFSPETWWRNLQRGRVVLSNGPLLRVRANDELPGHVFVARQGGTVELDVACQLSTRQKIEYLEIIKNGRVIESVRLDEWAAKGGRLPLVKFQESGWMLLRVVANSETGYRCAMTGPFYVEIGDQRRVNKKSAKFFLDWVYDRARQIRHSGVDANQLRAQLEPHRQARDFWRRLVEEGRP